MVRRRETAKEVKLDSVIMMQVRGLSVARATRDLDMNENELSRWNRKISRSEQQGSPSREVKKPDHIEVTLLG
jgi:transposase-like protein